MGIALVFELRCGVWISSAIAGEPALRVLSKLGDLVCWVTGCCSMCSSGLQWALEWKNRLVVLIARIGLTCV